MRLDARTKLLNPKWYEGMMASGYEGVREIQKRLTNTMGWSATAGAVRPPPFTLLASSIGAGPSTAARARCDPMSVSASSHCMLARPRPARLCPTLQRNADLASALALVVLVLERATLQLGRCRRHERMLAAGGFVFSSVSASAAVESVTYWSGGICHAMQVDNWVYDEANSTFIEDPEMQKRLMDANPNSFRKLVRPAWPEYV